MKSSLFFVVDAILIVLSAAVAWPLVTGGGVYQLGSYHLGLRSVGNPLFAAYVLFLVRLWRGPGVPFLGVSSLPVAAIPRRMFATLRSSTKTLGDISATGATGIVFAAIGLATLAKIANALAYSGFYSGDDVEIHEMTFHRLFHLDYKIWDLRSPIYPMLFAYPIQRILVGFGVTDTHHLVIAGRLVVIAFSTSSIWLLYRAACARLNSHAVAVIGALIFAFSKLQVTFGSSELPRPVATFFILGSFALLLRPASLLRPLAAGGVLALAGSFRFSEFAFLVPACAALALKRRWRDMWLVVGSAAATAALLLGVSDWLYWGQPFHSVVSAVDFTLARGLSTRGYQAWHYYLTNLFDWSNVLVVGAAIYATRRREWDLILWTWMPVLILSLLPHKEARYLVPVGPFLAMSAAIGLWDVSRRLVEWGHQESGEAARKAIWTATVLVVTLAACLVYEVDGFRFERSEAGVSVAKYIVDHGEQGVAMEQAWRGGGRLYLRRAEPFLNLDTVDVASADRLRAVCESPGITWLALQPWHLTADAEAVTAACGFQLVFVAQDGVSYHLYRRSGPG